MANFCDHCDGQRFDRARVLRALRQLRNDLRARDRGRGRKADDALALALKAARALDIPHLDVEDEGEGHVVH